MKRRGLKVFEKILLMRILGPAEEMGKNYIMKKLVFFTVHLLLLVSASSRSLHSPVFIVFSLMFLIVVRLP
jgi:hypothetical protein